MEESHKREIRIDAFSFHNSLRQHTVTEGPQMPGMIPGTRDTIREQQAKIPALWNFSGGRQFIRQRGKLFGGLNGIHMHVKF